MVSLSDLPIRDDLRGQTPYGAPQLHVRYALNVNENTHPIPEDTARHIVESLARAVLQINRYPDREFTVLREALAAYLGHELAPENIWAGNGSNEIIQQTLQAFGGPGRKVLAFPPTYSMHAIIAHGSGTEWVEAERDDPAVVDAFRLVRLPYHLSALTQAAAVAALEHAPAMLAMVDDIRGQRDRLVVELAQLGYRPYESWANFVLFGGLDSPKATFEALLERDILVRDVGIPGSLRVTAGTRGETSAFLAALAELGPGGAR